jgi:hypothetical protein
MSDEINNWEFISYDLWADGEGGYSVNDMFPTGIVLHIDDWESDIGVIKALRDAGLFGSAIVNEDSIDVDGDEDVIYINYENSPACELQRTRKAVTEGGIH